MEFKNIGIRYKGREELLEVLDFVEANSEYRRHDGMERSYKDSHFCRVVVSGNTIILTHANSHWVRGREVYALTEVKDILDKESRFKVGDLVRLTSSNRIGRLTSINANEPYVTVVNAYDVITTREPWSNLQEFRLEVGDLVAIPKLKKCNKIWGKNADMPYFDEDFKGKMAKVVEDNKKFISKHYSIDSVEVECGGYDHTQNVPTMFVEHVDVRRLRKWEKKNEK